MTTAHYELKKALQFKLAEMQTKNPQYSLRAFAKNLGVHAASLSEFFNDKRQFSPKLQKKILEKLNLSPDKKSALLSVIDQTEEAPTNVERVQLDTDNYFLVSDPIYYSILCLIETKDYIENYQWIAGRLRSTEDQVKLAIERLLRVQLLVRDEKGELRYNANAHLTTSDDVASASLRLRHADNLDAAKDALLNLPIEKRYFNFETLAISMEKLPEMKKIINDCRSRLIKISSEGEKDEVYEFCFNFFPRTSNIQTTDTLQ